MTEAWIVVAIGFGLGLSLAAPPGPITAYAAQRAARHGFWPGFLVTVGAMTGDGTYALLMGYGLIPLLAEYVRVLALLAILGALLMGWFAYAAYRSARAPPAPEAATTRRFPGGPLLGAFVAGYTLALTSPFNLGWWLTAGTTLFHDYGASVFVGFFLGLLVWSVVFVALVHWARRLRGVLVGVSYASAVLLAAFAAYLLVIGVRRLVEVS